MSNDLLKKSEMALQKTLESLQAIYDRSGRGDYLEAREVILQSLSNGLSSVALAEYNNKENSNGSSYTPD